MPPEPPPPPGLLCHKVFQLWKYARARPHKIQESKRLSSLGRGDPFAAAPRRPVGRKPRVSPSPSFLIASFPLCQTHLSTTWSFHDVYSRGMNLAESQSGRGHGYFCNLLIIRYHHNKGVETWPKKGCVSTPCFITH